MMTTTFQTIAADFNTPDVQPDTSLPTTAQNIEMEKSEVCKRVLDSLLTKANGKQAIVLSLSTFYRQLSEEDRNLAEKGKFNLDHPQAFDFELLAETLKKIRRHEPVVLNTYDPNAFSNTPNVLKIPAEIDIVIVEADADTRLSRKVLLDVCERKRNLNTVLENYFNFVKPAFEEFCLPTKKYADVILPRAPDNVVGVELIMEHLLQMITNAPNNANTSAQRLRFRNQSESAPGRIRPH
ncbi:unnamed protein product [Dibothriocephalus latus]|uniref:Phosphoribulokinase/uridine kinase domain-containing protein n=1 Tax=Dibothriocephalus latus TaxID=60516 RepID=A0A3P7L7J0_DIBLA|nr:unnamed protein product [Dibothriocephalus latus]